MPVIPVIFDPAKFRKWLFSPTKNKYFDSNTHEQSVVHGNLSFSATDKNEKLSIVPFNNPQPIPADDRFIRKKYPIKIDLSAGDIPKIKVSEDIIEKILRSKNLSEANKNKTYLHFFSNNTCCLCAKAELMHRLKKKEITEENFVEQIVIPFFYRFGCVEDGMTPPKWGERSHDFRGLLESYSESGVEWDDRIFLPFVCELEKLLLKFDNNKNNSNLWKFIYIHVENRRLLKLFYDFDSGTRKRKHRLSDNYKDTLTQIRVRYQNLKEAQAKIIK
ncbi:hypothetical protein [Candidatus Spongiihabitans sp.]|uniref:hypothetical protein n=1 Tax=Candidatus Spongiihabitans sp. TaxID=3101308 RepID=UPI003C7BA046